MRLLYSTGILLYALGVRIAALWNDKARLFVRGRRGLFGRLAAWRKSETRPVVWIHCASLGEFEQGRPVIEYLRDRHPEKAILLTFFSPSGYEVRKNYAGADHVCYLPVDTPANAVRFAEVVRPSLGILVKYEYWANHLLALRDRQVPVIVVSGIFRPGHRYFGWQHRFWKKVFASIDHFFVQNTGSERLLHAAGIDRVTVAGDTRFDRVVRIASESAAHPVVAAFREGRLTLIAGSSYPAEEQVVEQWLAHHPSAAAIIAPHEIGASRIASIVAQFGPEAARLTEAGPAQAAAARVLVVDTMGQLSSIYQHADMALIGGGFGKGIHNTLEAAVYGIPVAFGPAYERFDEAVGLVKSGGAVAAKDTGEMLSCLARWSKDESNRKTAGKAAGNFVASGAGALEKITKWLESQWSVGPGEKKRP